MNALLKIQKHLESGAIDERTAFYLKGFYENFKAATPNQDVEADQITFIDMVVDQYQNPYPFSCYHTKLSTPFNYAEFGVNLMRHLVDVQNSKLHGKDNLNRIDQQFRRGDNVILLSNHQTEADPQAITILLEKEFPELGNAITYVAGERVLKDPLAAPFSMGCNLLCIYSKKHIANPPEKRVEKQEHNRKAMQRLEQLMREGGLCLYIAPSGGRDRPDENGKVDVAEFDAQSIEMLCLLAQKANVPTHFYPLALNTYRLLPPPNTLGKEIGEERKVSYTPIRAYFGEEIEMKSLPSLTVGEKKQQRKERAEAVWGKVKELYNQIT